MKDLLNYDGEDKVISSLGEDTGKIKQIELFGISEQLKGRLLDGNNRRS